MLPKNIVFLIAGLILLSFASTQADAAKRKPPWRSWSASVHQKNPLVGKIWDVEEKLFLSPFELAGRLAFYDYILMGEVHDNPDHHRLQAWLIRNISYLDRHPAIIMEMINLSQGAMVNDFIASRKRAWREGYQKAKKKGRLKQWRREQRKLRTFGPSKQAQQFGPAIGWSRSGWPKWSTYQPIALAAFSQRLPIKAGNPDRPDTKIISREGFSSLGGPRVKKLGLGKPLARELRNALLADIKVSHCNLMPERALEPMARAQRYRDAVMGQQLRKVGLVSGAILIAGNGHVRKDRGVPLYLTERDPDATHTSLMIIEVDENTSNPEALVPKDEAGKPIADFVWYTPGKKRADPCKGMAKHFKKLKKLKKKKVSAAKISGNAKR